AVLHPDDRPLVGQREDGRNLHAGLDRLRDVVDEERKIDGGSDGAEVLDELVLAVQVVVRGREGDGIGTGALGGPAVRDRLPGAGVADPDDDRDAPIDGVDDGLDDRRALNLAEAGELAGRPGRPDAENPLVEEVADEAAERGMIDVLVFGQWRQDWRKD